MLRVAAAKAVHYERRGPEQTTLHRLVREHLETFLPQVEAGGAASLPQFVKDEFDATVHVAPKRCYSRAEVGPKKPQSVANSQRTPLD